MHAGTLLTEAIDLKQEFHDTEEMSQKLKHTRVSAMQVSRGAFQSTWLHAPLGGYSLQFIEFKSGTSICSGDAPNDCYAMLVPLKFTPGSRLLGQALNRNSIGLYAPGSEHADLTVAGCNEVVVVIPREHPSRVADEVELPNAGSHVRNASANGLEQLRRILARIPAVLEAGTSAPTPEAERSLSDMLGRGIVGALRSDSDLFEVSLGRPKLPRAAIMRRIREILIEREDEPVYAGELASLLGISQPSLQRVFQEWFGMSPARYLALRRLHLVRRRLRKSEGSTVTEIAGSSGFWDLSRFSKRYKDVFGELPSTTLRSSRQ